MKSMILETWRSFSSTASQVLILPDGCRDVIFRYERGCQPKWFVSPLFDTVEAITIQPETVSIGFRLLPGSSVDEERLLREIGKVGADDARAIELIEEFTHRAGNVSDALEALAESSTSVIAVAKSLGVHQRTLQRLVVSRTHRTPAYWLQIARIRRAARLVSEPLPLTEIAAICAFADQAHMTRAFKRWFGVSALAFRRNAQFMRMIAESGYDGDPLTGEQISIKKPSGSRT